MCGFPFARRIVALDGQVHPDAVAACRPDVVVQRWRRAGYVASILGLLRQIESEYFFWLEDDWTFRRPVDIAAMRAAMGENPSWMQIRLSKVGPLPPEERAVPLGPGLYRSAYGFSANPSLNRAREVRAGFDWVRRSWHSAVDGFEVGVSHWAAQAGVECVVADPGAAPAVEHEGYLESTPRGWHMTSSLETGAPAPTFSLGARPPLWRRLAMVLRLGRRCVALGARQLGSLAAYEVAFRVVTMRLPWDEQK
jgi:hypothetical protein